MHSSRIRMRTDRMPGGASFLQKVHASWGVGIPACTEADPPPMNRITHTSKNITLATTSLRSVTISVLQKYGFGSQHKCSFMCSEYLMLAYPDMEFSLISVVITTRVCG